MNISAFDSLARCLKATELSQLDLNDQGELIVNNEPSSKADHLKMDKIKHLFLEAIKMVLTTNDLDIDKAADEAQIIALKEKQITFLENFKESSLVKEIMPSKEAFDRLIEDQKKNFAQMLKISQEHFKT